jgi:hypothetical protein
LSPLLRVGALLVFGAVGCNQLLGIDESFVDPALEETDPAGGGERSTPPAGTSAGEPASLGGSPGRDGDPQPNGGAGGAGGAAPSDDVCEQYCELIGEHCVGEALQYRDDAQCLRICRALPVGEIDDDRVNTASCRRRYAGKTRYLAGPELATGCAYAGPGGDGRCGSNCEGFCAIAMAACSAEVSDPYFYESLDACLEDCEGLPMTRYEYGAVSAGNSLECRLFHASSAIMSDADEHCEHTLGITLCAE